MTNYKEILRVTAQGLSQRNTALACGVSRNTVMDVARRCRIQQLTWAEAQNMGNEEIKNRLFPNDRKQRDQTLRIIMHRLPDFAHIHAELAKPHVTLMLLWEEYLPSQPQGRGASLPVHPVPQVLRRLCHKGQSHDQDRAQAR